MTSNERVLIAGFLAGEAEKREAGTEKDALLAAANAMIGNDPEVARLCPSQAAMEEAGFAPFGGEEMLRERADDTRETERTTPLPAFRRGSHKEGRNQS